MLRVRAGSRAPDQPLEGMRKGGTEVVPGKFMVGIVENIRFLFFIGFRYP